MCKEKSHKGNKVAPVGENMFGKKHKNQFSHFGGCFLWAKFVSHNYTPILMHFEEDLLSFIGFLDIHKDI